MSLLLLLHSSNSNKEIVTIEPEMFRNSILVICLILCVYLAISIGQTTWKKWKKKKITIKPITN